MMLFCWSFCSNFLSSLLNFTGSSRSTLFITQPEHFLLRNQKGLDVFGAQGLLLGKQSTRLYRNNVVDAELDIVCDAILAMCFTEIFRVGYFEVVLQSCAGLH